MKRRTPMNRGRLGGGSSGRIRGNVRAVFVVVRKRLERNGKRQIAERLVGPRSSLTPAADHSRSKGSTKNVGND